MPHSSFLENNAPPRTAELDEGNDGDALRFFPLLPSAFSSSSRPLVLQHWQSVLLPSSAGRVSLVKDDAFPLQRVLELTCDAGAVDGVCATFPSARRYIGSPLPVLTVQLKNLQQYVRLAADVEDCSGRQRTFSASNQQTVARMAEDACSMPMQLTVGWNKVDRLAHITRGREDMRSAATG